MKKLVTLFLAGCTVLAAAAAPSILTLKQSITDNSIIYPESFETDTHKMMQNWYLQNYMVLNTNYSKVPVIDASDEVYIKRLREKIESDPARPEIIQTVRGMGYRVQ